MSKSRQIEVFQDLMLLPKNGDLKTIREFLVNNQTIDWVHHPDRENEMCEGAGRDSIIFRYEGARFPKAGLYLFSNDEGYKVTNIVPEEPVRELNYFQYNSLLEDFASQVARPAKSKPPFNISFTKRFQSITDRGISEETAKELESFSNLANKSTLYANPRDAERWKKFVILAFNEESKLDSEFLERWLNEIHRWDEESAMELAMKYDSAFSILEAHEQYRKGLIR